MCLYMRVFAENKSNNVVLAAKSKHFLVYFHVTV